MNTNIATNNTRTIRINKPRSGAEKGKDGKYLPPLSEEAAKSFSLFLDSEWEAVNEVDPEQLKIYAGERLYEIMCAASDAGWPEIRWTRLCANDIVTLCLNSGQAQQLAEAKQGIRYAPYPCRLLAAVEFLADIAQGVISPDKPDGVDGLCEAAAKGLGEAVKAAKAVIS